MPTDTQPTISIIITTYNSGEEILTCIDSLLQQTTEVLELVIVNNGNSQTITSALKSLATDHKNIQLLSGHGNIGFSAACNLGAHHTNGDLLCFINPDCLLPSDLFQQLATHIPQLQPPWLLGCRIMDSSGIEQRGSRRHALTPFSILSHLLLLHRLLPRIISPLYLHKTPVPTSLMEAQVISGAFFLLPKDTFKSIGGMDEKYFLHFEDVDLCYRIKQIGGHIYFAPNLKILHIKSSSAASKKFVEWEKCKSLWRYLKHFKWGLYSGTNIIILILFFLRYFFYFFLTSNTSKHKK